LIYIVVLVALPILGCGNGAGLRAATWHENRTGVLSLREKQQHFRQGQKQSHALLGGPRFAASHRQSAAEFASVETSRIAKNPTEGWFTER
jgi:hypothetical protein